MGYKCKCEYTFCKKHRLPEFHDCDFDFMKIGKKKIEDQNKKVNNKKMNMIGE